MKTKIQTNWDLSLLYASKKDPQIEKDLVMIENVVNDFEKKYKNDKKYLVDEVSLFSPWCCMIVENLDII